MKRAIVRVPANRRTGTLEVVLVRTFALVRQTRLEHLSSLTIEVPDETGTRWVVKLTRVRPARKDRP